MRSRCAAKSATSSLSQTARVLHLSHNRRHAPAAQCHNVVPPLLPNHQRNAQRVPAHVLHVLQPHGRSGWPSCNASCCPPCAWSGPSHPLDQRSGCCKGLPSSAAFVENTNVRKKLPLPHISALSRTHKGGVMGKRSPPHNGCTRAHAKATPFTSHRKIEPCAQHKNDRKKRNGANPITRWCPLLLSSPTDWCPTLTNEARRTPSAPLRVRSAGRCPVALLPSQWGTHTIVVADHTCL
ncbi:hypothetical protein TcG_09198 [Trypanosoma cruzi]|nr:hypothetical protein TcG_09198 [Trypanosoma cruzi]